MSKIESTSWNAVGGGTARNAVAARLTKTIIGRSAVAESHRSVLVAEVGPPCMAMLPRAIAPLLARVAVHRTSRRAVLGVEEIRTIENARERTIENVDVMKVREKIGTEIENATEMMIERVEGIEIATEMKIAKDSRATTLPKVRIVRTAAVAIQISAHVFSSKGQIRAPLCRL